MGERVGETAQAYIDFFASRTMLRRVGTPEEIASGVAFLASAGGGLHHCTDSVLGWWPVGFYQSFLGWRVAQSRSEFLVE